MPFDRPALVVHGHFYQPPRENPWTGDVDREESAAPWHDWNERIHSECYRANGVARVLDRWGRLERIVNNFEELSFNVGPTLAAWMVKRHPGAFERILEADRRSIPRRGGHGNAIAQAYNHPILPLCNGRDRRTQVRWGKADFRARFGREPESLWLPECAVDAATLETLIEEGMRWAVLAPEQAAKVRPLGAEAGAWQDVRGGRVDPSRAYAWLHRDGSGRSIALFFYDGPVARAIAFEGALASSQGLVERFEKASQGPGRLVHVATDGESYGHHFKFGDRSLAYALLEEAPARGFRVTNYGEYLDHHPPEFEVEIALGDDGRGSSWSCAHGIGRWSRDCGCQTGGREGWTQAWRAPLRAALDLLRDEAARLFDEHGRDFFADPWEARDLYVRRLLDPSRPPEEFLAAAGAPGLPEAARVRALSLLESQQSALLMYTSCGWFFNDLSGIETVQVLKYAGRLMDELKALGLAAPEEPFLEALAEAKSNVPSAGNGADVWRKMVEPARTTAQGVAAHLSIERLLEAVPAEGEVAGYRYALSLAGRRQEGRLRIGTARVELTSITSARRYDLALAAVHLGAVDFYCALRPWPGERAFRRSVAAVDAAFSESSLPKALRTLHEEFGPEEAGLEQLLPDVRARIVETVFGDLVDQLSRQYERLFDDNRRIVELFRRGGIEVPRVLKTAAEFTLARRFEAAVVEQKGSLDPERYVQAQQIAREAERFGFEVDTGRVRKLLEERVLLDVRAAVASPSRETASSAASVVTLASLLGVPVDLERAQDALWPVLAAPDPPPELKELALVLGFGAGQAPA